MVEFVRLASFIQLNSVVVGVLGHSHILLRKRKRMTEVVPLSSWNADPDTANRGKSLAEMRRGQ